jgi:hypothetical protein
VRGVTACQQFLDGIWVAGAYAWIAADPAACAPRAQPGFAAMRARSS